jgi:hypothetical protein
VAHRVHLIQVLDMRAVYPWVSAEMLLATTRFSIILLYSAIFWLTGMRLDSFGREKQDKSDCVNYIYVNLNIIVNVSK